MTMMTAKRSAARRPQQTLRNGNFAQRKSAQKKSASTPKHESASLARQPPRGSREATHQVSPAGGRAKAEVDEKTNRDRVMNSHRHEQQRLVVANYLMHHIRPNLDRSTYREERMEAAGLAAGLARPACKKNPYGNLVGPQEVEVEALQAGAIMALWLVLENSEYKAHGR